MSGAARGLSDGRRRSVAGAHRARKRVGFAAGRQGGGNACIGGTGILARVGGGSWRARRGRARRERGLVASARVPDRRAGVRIAGRLRRGAAQGACDAGGAVRPLGQRIHCAVERRDAALARRPRGANRFRRAAFATARRAARRRGADGRGSRGGGATGQPVARRACAKGAGAAVCAVRSRGLVGDGQGARRQDRRGAWRAGARARPQRRARTRSIGARRLAQARGAVRLPVYLCAVAAEARRAQPLHAIVDAEARNGGRGRPAARFRLRRPHLVRQ